MKQERIVTYNGVIGSYDALKIFMTPYTIFKRATREEIKIWEKYN